MRIIVADFETYFERGVYSLQGKNSLSTEAYIRDPRFEAHGCAIKWEPDTLARWYEGDHLRQVLRETDWSDVMLVCHHMQFDGLILSHHYDVHPKLLDCTMALARMMLGTHQRVGLDKLRVHFGMPLKSTPYDLFNGKHWHELTEDVKTQVAEGACDEVESIWTIFSTLAKDFPREEFEVQDTVLKMFTEPVLRADTALLAEIWKREETAKTSRMQNLGVTEDELQSADRFKALLEEAGVEIEYKEGKNSLIPAFAATDDFMRALLEDPDDYIRGLVETRLKVKSTLMQTRAATLGWTASRGALPVYLNYAGAATLRPTGGDKLNWLNFTRNTSVKEGQISVRKSILAPEGWLLAPIDSSQIECRVLHYLAGGPDDPVIQLFRDNKDPYVDLASLFYKEPVYKPKDGDPRKAEMEAKRGMGKQGRLMCGYGSGGPKFKLTAKNGLYGPPVEISLEDANAFVALYRSENPSICARNTGYWAQCDRMIARLAGGPPVDWGPLHVRDHRIYLPNGCAMIYDTMEYYRPKGDEEGLRDWETGGYWRMRTRQGWKKMWGAKLTQNICEAVSRVIVSQAMVRITRMGYRVLNWPYDELLVLIPKDGREKEHLQKCMNEMKREPTWLPGIPLDCEGSLGERYSK